MQKVETKEKLWTKNLILVFTGNFLLFFSFYFLLPMLPLYLYDEFHAGKELIGIILSGYTVTALCIRPFGGYLVDSYQRKKVLLIFYFIFFIFFAGYILATTILVFAIVRAMHGFSFGAVTVANSTMAIDVMNPSRRAEGIGYYGLSNNLAMALAPVISLYLYGHISEYSYIFFISLLASGLGLLFVSRVKPKTREIVKDASPISFDRFFLVKGVREGLTLMFFSFAFGIMTTYMAIYVREEMGGSCDSGLFFIIYSCGLMLSRFVMGHGLKMGYIIQNVTIGMVVCVIGFIMFIALHFPIAYYISALVIGFGIGSFCPGFQTMFINLAPHTRRGTANSSYLTSWDLGLGIGVLAGGYLADAVNYFAAYCMASVACVLGLTVFLLVTAKHFKANKLR